MTPIPTAPTPAGRARPATRWLGPLRWGALLLALLLGGLAWPTPAAAQAEVVTEARVYEIAKLLRCPVCVSESVAASSSPISVQMREQIQEMLVQGRSEREILGYFQERYGDWILLEPPKRGLHLLVWLLPAVAALVGLALLLTLVRRWTRAGREVPAVDEADLQRLREALREQE